MKIKKIILSIVFMSLGLVSMAQEKIEWKDIETAEKEISKKANKDKKYFIDCYTDWCGWCKKMDKDTFSDTLIAKLMNHYFVSAKFDAEQKEDVTVNGKTYSGNTNKNGQVTFNLKITKKGKYTAKINCAGDNTYDAKSKSVKITVK